jgi:hypothetical protein
LLSPSFVRSAICRRVPIPYLPPTLPTTIAPPTSNLYPQPAPYFSIPNSAIIPDLNIANNTTNNDNNDASKEFLQKSIFTRSNKQIYDGFIPCSREEIRFTMQTNSILKKYSNSRPFPISLLNKLYSKEENPIIGIFFVITKDKKCYVCREENHPNGIFFLD